MLKNLKIPRFNIPNLNLTQTPLTTVQHLITFIDFSWSAILALQQMVLMGGISVQKLSSSLINLEPYVYLTQCHPKCSFSHKLYQLSMVHKY